MADTFKVLASGYVKPFNQQKLTNEQRHARQVLQTHLDDIMQVNSRGMYLHELTVCVAGFAEEDENEEIDVTHFSEYNYFKVFSQDLVSYSDKFDFLLLCVRHWICQVHAAFVERFLRLIDGVLTPFNDENPIQTVLDLVVLTTPRVAAEADMETRDKWLYDFVHKENWPLYQQELARLEAEQEVFEREQRQAAYKSLFGWECTESPLPYSDRMRGLRVALIGPPGAGKTTQALLLEKQYNIQHIAVGPLLRDFADSTDSEEALAVAEAMQHGQLVDDQVVWALVLPKIASTGAHNGYVLDGFPRTKAQATLLAEYYMDTYQELTAVLNFVVPETTVAERAEGRLYHKASHRSYHKHLRPPQQEGLDDWTKEPLLRRGDDKPIILHIRMGEFIEDTRPLIGHYKQQGRLYNLDGTKPWAEVFQDARVALREAYRPPVHEQGRGTNIVLLGSPGSGKGTQALRLKEKFGLAVLSPGDLLRAEMMNGTALGRRAGAAIMTARSLARDGGDNPEDGGARDFEDVLMELLAQAFQSVDCSGGFVLDGFPSTVRLATRLEELLDSLQKKVTVCVQLEVDNRTSIQRCQGRLLHKASGRLYHARLHPPKAEGVDDVTGEPLVELATEPEQALADKLSAYSRQIVPVLRHFERQGCLFTVNGQLSIEEVARDMEEIIGRAQHLIAPSFT